LGPEVTAGEKKKRAETPIWLPALFPHKEEKGVIVFYHVRAGAL
jgi:hypothetical protein